MSKRIPKRGYQRANQRAASGRRVRSSASTQLRLENLETRVMLAGDWQNSANPLDVNASDGPAAVTPLDALLVINELNIPTVSDPETGRLPDLEPGMEPPPYFDVDGNGRVSPLDALLVINGFDPVEDIQPDNPQAADSVIAGTQAALSGGINHDTLVNTTTTRNQSNVSLDANSSLLVSVWNSSAQDGSSFGVYGQRYDAFGEKIGSEFLVNSTTNKSQRNPVVAVSEDGRFVVVWQSQGQDGSGWGVYGQSFDVVAQPIGAEFRINSTTRGAQTNPSVDFLGDAHRFVVAWEGRGGGDKNGIHARVFDVDDGPVGGEFLVNASTAGDQSRPDVTGFGNDSFAIVWEGRIDGDSRSIGFRSFTDLGTIPSNEFRINQELRGQAMRPAIASLDDGDLIVAWQQRPDVAASDVRARRLHPNGDFIGNEFFVNQTTSSIQQGPDIASQDDGFAITWFGNGPGDNRGVYTRLFGITEAEAGDEILVNRTTTSIQSRSAIAPMNKGFVTAWQGNGVGDDHGIYARFFDSEPRDPPQLLAVGDQTVDENSTLTIDIDATDPDSPITDLRFALDVGPAGATIDPISGLFTYTPGEADGPGTENVTVRVFDINDDELFDTDSFVITVNEVNMAPTLDAIDDQNVDEFATLMVTFTASDNDVPANNLTFSVDALPDNATLDSATGQFSFTPGELQGGQMFTIQVAVTDDGNPALSDTTSFNIAVNEVNEAPVISAIADTTVDELTLFSLTPTTNDPDGDTLTFTLTQSPAGAMIDASTGEITWTPTEEQGPGSFDFTVMVSDNNPLIPLTDSQTFVVNVNEVNSAPVLDAIEDQTVDEFQMLTVTATATDSDLPANELTFSLTDPPAGASIDAVTGEFTWTPDETQGGQDFTITVVVTDNGTPAAMAMTSFVVSVAELNQPPVLAAIPDATINEFDTFTTTAMATDQDDPANVLTYSFDLAPVGTTIDSATGEISWTPGEADGPSDVDFVVRVTDNGVPVAATTTSFVVMVLEVNSAPTIDAVPDQAVDELDTLMLAINASDSDLPANELTFSLVNPPENASIDSDGVFVFAPSEAQGGMVFTIEVMVTDDAAVPLMATAMFDVTVNEVDSPPILSNLRLLADTGTSAIDRITTNPTIVGDIFDDTMIVSLTGRVEGGPALDIFDIVGDINLNGTFTVDSTTLQILSATVPLAEGDYSIEFVASDAIGQMSAATIDFVYLVDNESPVLSEVPDQTATEDVPFALDLATFVSDPDTGDVVQLSALLEDLTPLPSWLSVSSMGNLFGLPANGDVGMISVLVTAVDSQGLSTTDVFAIDIQAVNDPPIIGDLPDAIVDIDDPFSRDIGSLVSDEEGEDVTIDVTGLPGWLDYDSATGLLTGTPTDADVGTSTVTVTATDIIPQSTIAFFDVTVEQINDPPFVSTEIPDQTLVALESFSIDLDDFFSDVDAGDSLTYSIAAADGRTLPEYLMLDGATNVLSGTPTMDGAAIVEVTATDGAGETAVDVFVITVGTTNNPPFVLPLPAQEATADEAFSFDISAFILDADAGDTVSVFALLADSNPLPAWLTFDNTTLLFSGTPAATDVGNLDIAVIATDASGESTIQSLALDVVTVNHPVVLDAPIPDQSVDQDNPFVLELSDSFSDSDVGDALVYMAVVEGSAVLPDWLTIDTATGRLEGTPAAGDVGELVIAVRVEDSETQAEDTFVLTVNDVDDAPTLIREIPNQSTVSGGFFVLGTGGFFNDLDEGDSLNFLAELSGGGPLPAWLSFNSETGVLSGFPMMSDAGVIDVRVTAVDSSLLSASDSFLIEVAAPVMLGQNSVISVTPEVAVGPANLFSAAPAGRNMTWRAQIVDRVFAQFEREDSDG